MITKKKPGLNPRQRRFVQEYLKDQNATQAYIRTYGGTQLVAESNSSRLMGNAKVKIAVERGLARLAERSNVTAEKNTRRLAEWAYEKKVRPSDSIKACELLGKILGQFSDGTSVTVSAEATVNEAEVKAIREKQKSDC